MVRALAKQNLEQQMSPSDPSPRLMKYVVTYLGYALVYVLE